jgi:hypothetical protein
MLIPKQKCALQPALNRSPRSSEPCNRPTKYKTFMHNVFWRARVFGLNWIHLSQSRVQCWAFESTGCFKKRFTNFKAYINIFRGYIYSILRSHYVVKHIKFYLE